jgi:tRNA-Thr(GGU) m(6)t(6)A37 methyltransferase TsaA
MQVFTMRPIGWVRSPIREVLDDCWGGVESCVELDETQFSADSLQGLEEFSHVVVVFHFHLIAPDDVTTGLRYPRGRKDWPNVGIFAQPAKARPNHLGVTTCPILRVDGTRLWVKELDAIDGTPVLDLKPYLPEFGPRTEVRQAAWTRELMRGYFGRMSGVDSA